MRAHHSKLHRADVVAAFENQDDADEAVLQLRLAGFDDEHIGYFTRHPTRGLTDLIDHDHAFAGSVIGGVLGILMGVGAARLLDRWSDMAANVRDPLGLMLTLATFGALFLGFVGWGIGVGISRRAVEAPAIDPSVGAFIIAVAAGPASQTAWAAIRAHGGHELPPGAMTAHPIAV
jgi:hypothetical protein